MIKSKNNSKNNDIIYIKSKIADYDKVSNNTVFRNNTNILFGKQKVDANIIKLNFINNSMKFLRMFIISTEILTFLLTKLK